MRETPSISVLLAVHNGMPYLPRAVDSVLRQTFDDFELLVVDDGSTDETRRYLEALEDARVRCTFLDKTGVAAARNAGLRSASSTWIAALDADDVAYDRWLQCQWSFIHEQAGCVMAGCQVDLIDEHDETAGARRFPVAEDAIRWQMAFGAPMVHSGAVYRRSAALDAGAYRGDFVPAEDYDLWSRLASAGALRNYPQTLVRYRLHAQSVTSTKLDAQVERCGVIAANYAKGVCHDIDSRAMAELYYFLSSGDGPGRVGWDDLVRTYRTFKTAFLGSLAHPSEELFERIATVQQTLRWYCLEGAQRNLFRPWKAWTWLRRAGQFDPENGTIRRLCARALRRGLRPHDPSNTP